MTFKTEKWAMVLSLGAAIALWLVVLWGSLTGCTDSGAYRSPQRGGPGGGYYGVPTTTTMP